MTKSNGFSWINVMTINFGEVCLGICPVYTHVQVNVVTDRDDNVWIQAVIKEGEREEISEKECMCVCVCVCERERES